MKHKPRVLLLIDAALNILIGAALLASPPGMLEFFGLSVTPPPFHAIVLGGVIFGIGIVLVMELREENHRGVRGLGVAGAITINACGGGVLLLWLVAGDLNRPVRGRFVLWSVAVAVLGIGVAEIAAGRTPSERK